MTHDLLVTVLRASGVGVDHVEIVSLIDGVFHAALVLEDGRRIDSRASDAVAVAVRLATPVLCDAEVLAESGLDVQEATHEEEELEEFRAFLDTVSADDFVATDEGEPGPSPS